jgi:hypothetical protein
MFNYRKETPMDLILSLIFKKLLTLYGTRRFITMFKTARQFSLPCARGIQSTLFHPVSLRRIIGEFVKQLRKATRSLAMSVCPHEENASSLTDFHEISYLRL